MSGVMRHDAFVHLNQITVVSRKSHRSNPHFNLEVVSNFG